MSIIIRHTGVFINNKLFHDQVLAPPVSHLLARAHNAIDYCALTAYQPSIYHPTSNIYAPMLTRKGAGLTLIHSLLKCKNVRTDPIRADPIRALLPGKLSSNSI